MHFLCISYSSFTTALGIMSDKKIEPRSSPVNLLRPIYSDIAPYLTPYEELPIIEFLTIIVGKREDGRSIAKRLNPLRSPEWTDRHPIQTTEKKSIAWVFKNLRDCQVYSLHYNPPGYWDASIAYLQQHLIMARRDNPDLYRWYLNLVGMKNESEFTFFIDKRVKILESDPRALLFHIRQRNTKVLQSVSLATLYSESMQERLGSKGEKDLPNSFILEIFLSGWKQQYELCGRMKPNQLLSLIPSLAWEGKFEELLWLTMQRIPYSMEDLKGFEAFKIERKELKTFLGKDRPLLSSSANTVLFSSSGKDKDGGISIMEWTARFLTERAHNLDVSDESPIFSHVSIAAIRDMLISFISDQQVIYSTSPDREVLKELIEKRETSIKKLRSSILREKLIFEECCRMGKMKLVSGYRYMTNGSIPDDREKATKNIIGRWELECTMEK